MSKRKKSGALVLYLTPRFAKWLRSHKRNRSGYRISGEGGWHFVTDRKHAEEARDRLLYLAMLEERARTCPSIDCVGDLRLMAAAIRARFPLAWKRGTTIVARKDTDTGATRTTRERALILGPWAVLKEKIGPTQGRWKVLHAGCGFAAATDLSEKQAIYLAKRLAHAPYPYLHLTPQNTGLPTWSASTDYAVAAVRAAKQHGRRKRKAA